MRRLAIISILLAPGCNIDTPSAIPRPANAVDVEFVFCRYDLPDWVAIKNEGHPWRLVSFVGRQAYQYPVTPRVIVAYGVSDQDDHTQVLYVTAEELDQARCGPTLGDKLNFLNIETPLPDPEPVTAFAAAGSGFGWQQNSSTQLRIENVPEGPQDLLTVWAPTRDSTPSYVLRRGVQALHSNLFENVSFNGGAARSTGRFGLNLSEMVDGRVESMILTSRGTHWDLGSTRVVNGAGKYMALPAELLESGDLHRLSLLTGDGRGVALYSSSNAAESMTLGPALERPSVLTVATTPSLRMRAVLPSQAAYPSFAKTTFYQTSGFTVRKFTIVVSAGYMAGRPEQWTMEMPELPISTQALDPNGETFWHVEAWNAPSGLFFGHLGAASGSMAQCAVVTSFDTLPSRACRTPLRTRTFGYVPAPLFERDTTTTPP
jgi:hypothetical protein